MRKSLALALVTSLFPVVLPAQESLLEKYRKSAGRRTYNCTEIIDRRPAQSVDKCLSEAIKRSPDEHYRLQDCMMAAGREISGILYGEATDEQKLSMLTGLRQKYGECAALYATSIRLRDYPGGPPAVQGTYEQRAETLVRAARGYKNFEKGQIAANEAAKRPKVDTKQMADRTMRLPRSVWLDLTFEGERVRGNFLPDVTAGDKEGSIYFDRKYMYGFDRPVGNISLNGRRHVLRTGNGDLIWSFSRTSLEKYAAVEDDMRSRRMNEFNGKGNFSEFVKLSGIIGEKFDGKIKVSVGKNSVYAGDQVFGTYVYVMDAKSRTRRVYMNGFDPITKGFSAGVRIDKAVMNRLREMFSGFGGRRREIIMHGKFFKPIHIPGVEYMVTEHYGDEMAVIIEDK